MLADRPVTVIDGLPMRRISSGRAPRRRRWHRVYYGLAVFDVLVVAFGLFLNHEIIGTHDEAIQTNQVWEKRLDRFLDLGTTAGEVKTPGSNVLESEKAFVESARRDEALDRFRDQIETIRRDLKTVPVPYATRLRTDLYEVEARMADMTAQADLIFGDIRADRPALAGSRMAAMDRRYQDVIAAITHTRENVGEIQRKLFAEQASHTNTLRGFEFLIAGFVFVMISMATAYGHRIRKELERHDTERARYVVELEESHRQLAGANASLNQEVAARSHAEANLRLSEERYALAARGANDGLWDWDLQTGEVYYAPRWKVLLGYREDELGSRPAEWLDRVHPDDRAEVNERIQAAIDASGAFEIEHQMRHRDGTYHWMLARGVATVDGESRRLVGSHSDVTGRKVAELSLLHESLHDDLTGVPNRVLFLDRLEHALQRGRRLGEAPFAVMYVDLDRFKQINDGLGHLAGDELLVKFADLLRRAVRPGDTVARLGGDEFAILVDDVHCVDEAVTVAERILVELRTPMSVDGAEVYTSASIGIAMGESDHASTAEVLRNADTALYHAKHAGRGRLEVFESEGSERAFNNLRLEIDLRGAIARNELHLLYQPIVELSTETMVGVEALARWNHPELGSVPPSTFIPMAEESGDITAIGDWVLREACRAVAEWNYSQGGHPIYVAVNASAHQLMDDDFANRVQAIVAETGLTAGCLRLEVTESSVIRDRERATTLLRQLREFGVQVCIDDFGTGHSALSYVQDLPVDGIKIDQSFINRLADGEHGDYIVGVLLDLAWHAGLTVVAEGIETAAQRDALIQFNCDYGQGYLFDRPMPLDELAKRVKNAEESPGITGERRFLAPHLSSSTDPWDQAELGKPVRGRSHGIEIDLPVSSPRCSGL